MPVKAKQQQFASANLKPAAYTGGALNVFRVSLKMAVLAAFFKSAYDKIEEIKREDITEKEKHTATEQK